MTMKIRHRILKKLEELRAVTMAGAIALVLGGGAVIAQQVVLAYGTGFQGMLQAYGHQPTATGCTLAANSTDSDGTCTASATSGAIVFYDTTFNVAPFCIVVDATASPSAVYTVTALQITLTTIVSSHVLRYHCVKTAAG